MVNNTLLRPHALAYSFCASKVDRELPKTARKGHIDALGCLQGPSRPQLQLERVTLQLEQDYQALIPPG